MFTFSEKRNGILMILEPFWSLFGRYGRTNGRTDGGQDGPASPALAQDDSQPVDGLRPPTPIYFLCISYVFPLYFLCISYVFPL